MPTLHGHFAVFNRWAEIDSLFEGHFLERIAPGAFAHTFAADREAMRVTFQHGRDPYLGDKPLGPIETLREDRVGALYEVPLLDTHYAAELVPGLRAGTYGASFRFRVLRQEIDEEPGRLGAQPGRAARAHPEGDPRVRVRPGHLPGLRGGDGGRALALADRLVAWARARGGRSAPGTCQHVTVLSGHPRSKVVTYAVVAGIGVAVIVWGWLAIADPGTRIDWQLPDVPGSEIVADIEVKSDVVDSWSRYLVVLAEPGTTAEGLTRDMRAALDDAGWETRLVRGPGEGIRYPAGEVEAESGSKYVSFGPAISQRRFVPLSVRELINTTEGPARRKVAVGMAEH